MNVCSFFLFFFISCLYLYKAYIVIYCIWLACQSINKNKCENAHSLSLVDDVSKIDSDGLDRQKNKQNKGGERARGKKHSCTCRSCFCCYLPEHVAKYLTEENMYREYRQEVCLYVYISFFSLFHLRLIWMNYILCCFFLSY